MIYFRVDENNKLGGKWFPGRTGSQRHYKVDKLSIYRRTRYNRFLKLINQSTFVLHSPEVNIQDTPGKNKFMRKR